MSHPLLGYFDSPEQTTPAYDPGWNETPCLVCMRPLGGPDQIRTTSVMLYDRSDGRSWFYRVHRACDDRLTDDERGRIEVSAFEGTR
jgi:hypothetical protein